MNGVMDDREDFASLFEESVTPGAHIEPGQKVEGAIIAISGDSAFLDIGMKQEGIMEKEDLPPDTGVGDKVTAYVISMNPGSIRLSRSMSGAGLAAIEDAMSNAIPVEGKIRALCKGGYQVELLGKTAFCPGSQMERLSGLADEDLVGKQFAFLITRMENSGRNIVVSRRALLEKERNENLERILSSLKAGDVVEGKITRLAPYGAFMEIAPYVEGMIHISELSWSRIEQPDEAVSVGDVVRAKILEAGVDDKGKGRISLSIKQADGDPWKDISGKFKTGDIVNGKVRRLAPFGAFVEIAPGVEGLVHLSEMSWEKRVARAEEIVQPGEEILVKIKEINPDARRISLSIKDARDDPWQDAPELFPVGKKVEGIVESRSSYGYFISLKPGITGLLPLSALKEAPPELKKLSPGDRVNLLIQNIDSTARRISLILSNNSNDLAEEDKSWREHASSQPDESMGVMAQAFKKAMQKKGKKE